VLRDPIALRRWRSALLAIAAAALLNAALTFYNIWPTLGIHWQGELSVELAVLLMVLSVANAWRSTPRWTLTGLAALLVMAVLGRYGEVTAPALYGREVNLYWDVRQLASVTAMLVRVAPPGRLMAMGLGALTVLALLFLSLRWALGAIDSVLRFDRAARIVTGGAALALIACYAVQTLTASIPLPQFSIPVSRTYGIQIARTFDALSSRADRVLPASPPLQSSLTALGGGDVLLVFAESLGRVIDDRPTISRALEPARHRLEAALLETQRGVVSAYVRSPTFGGHSTLAHLSLLSGIEVSDPSRYALLMTQSRPTLLSAFKARGYRTVDVMPGMQQAWPEGAFYGFDQIYAANDLQYRGPDFGWWRIPDQFSLAAIDAAERQRRPRQPLFVFFPTVSTHMPFAPVPPLQADTQRLLSAHPFDADALRRSLSEEPDWTHMDGNYVQSVTYFFDVIANYLRVHANDPFVLIVLGDHQPAANVSGASASWDVPVYVISRQTAILDALEAQGFRAGLAPADRDIGQMSELTARLLAAFDGTARLAMDSAVTR
jgi:hypothetical protein